MEASDAQTKLFIQIIDFLGIRRRPDLTKYFNKFLKITEKHRAFIESNDWTKQQYREYLNSLNTGPLNILLSRREREDLHMEYRELATDMYLEHMWTLPEIFLPGLFADAAVRAEQTGFDGIELHYAHAYTMASFLPATNTCEDGYGGVRENMVRLPIEVYQRVKRKVSDNFVVGYRYLSDECIEDRSTLEDIKFFGIEFTRTGMNFLSLSRGGKFDDVKESKIRRAIYPYTGRSGYECMSGYISDRQGVIWQKC